MCNNQPTRVWFMNQGCKQVPLNYTRGIVRWAHPDGYFLNAQGQKTSNKFSPRMQAAEMGGSVYPKDSCNVLAHILMALAFHGPRPIDPTTGKPCIVHHLVPDKLDYRPTNLLCWLTRAEHAEADRRQRALKKVVPDGDLRLFTYERLRELQDPRTMSREQFETELAALADQHFTRDTFATNPPPGLTPFDARMSRDMSHHMEC